MRTFLSNCLNGIAIGLEVICCRWFWWKKGSVDFMPVISRKYKVKKYYLDVEVSKWPFDLCDIKESVIGNNKKI